MTDFSFRNPTGRNMAWLALVVVFFCFIYEIRAVLPPFVIGILAAYFLDPAAERLEREGWPRGVAAAIIIALFFAVMCVGLLFIVPAIAHQAMELLNAFPGYIAEMETQYGEQVQHWLGYLAPDQAEALKSAAGDTAQSMLKVAGTMLAGVLVSGIAMLNLLALLLITPLVAFYFLRDWRVVMARLDHLLPLASADAIREQARQIDRTLAGFIRGQLNVCFILAVYYGLMLSIVGLKFGLVIGIATGVLMILPFIGALSMALLAFTIGLIQFGMTSHFFMILGVYAVGQFMESYFLTPRLVGERVGLHPLWIIFGMLAGGALFGFAGVLLAVPATAVIGVLIRFAIDRYLASPLYQES